MNRSVSDLTNSYDENERKEVDFALPENLDEDEAENMNEAEQNLETSFNEADFRYEIDDDVTEILQQAEDKELGKNLSKSLRGIIKKALARYAAKIERKQRSIVAKAVSSTASPISLKNIVDQVVKKPNSAGKVEGEENKETEATSGADFMSIMLQKRIAGMQKQVELAEQKARSSTLQWVADKKKYKEVVDQHKQEIIELNQKLSILDRKLRLIEQLNRDGNMLKSDNATEEEVNEITKLKESHATLEVEITEKRQLIAGLSTELSDAKIELQSNKVKIDFLKEKVEEFTRSEEKLTVQLESLTKENEENVSKLYHLTEDYKQVCQTLENEKSNYRNLKESIETAHQTYELKIAEQKKLLDDYIGQIHKLGEEKENLSREISLKTAKLERENRALLIEKEQLTRDHAHMVKALQMTAKGTQNILLDFQIHERKANKSLEDYAKITEKLKNEVTGMNSNLSTILETSEKKMKEMEEKFQSKQQMLLKSFEESNQQMKNLQLSLEAKEKEVADLIQENRGIKQTLETNQSLIQQLESELTEERNGPKPLPMEEINKIKEQERQYWEALLEESQHEVQTLTKEKESIQTKLAESEELLEKIQNEEEPKATTAIEKPHFGKLLEKEIQVIESELEETEEQKMRRQSEANLNQQEFESVGGEVGLDRIEQILRNSLVTNNYYFNKETNAFSNYYPMDESFLSDLIRTFFMLGKELNNLLHKSKDFQPSQSEITQDTEKFLGMAAQDILIKLEKSKEELIIKVKNDAKDEMVEKVEATIKQLTELKQSELFDQKEKFEQEMEKMKQQNETETGELLDEIERLKAEYEEEMYILQQKIATLSEEHANSSINPASTKSSISNRAGSPVTFSDNNISQSSAQNSSDSPPVGIVSRQNSMAVTKKPSTLATMSRKSTMRSSVRGMKTGIESLTAEELQSLKDQIKVEVEKELRDNLTEELLGKHKINEAVTKEEANKDIVDLFKSLPPKYQNMNLQQMRQELLTGDLMNIGVVQNENFDRLRNKNFGNDSLIALTILEHHARYDSGENNDQPNEVNSSFAAGTSRQSTDAERKNRMQLKALEIKRKLLTQEIIQETPILDLLTYLNATDEHLSLFDKMNAWKSLLYYQSGGIFRDVLEVHRDVIKKCIAEAGGIPAAVKAVSLLPPNTKTDKWPQDFRIKALEIYRNQLFMDSQKQQESISGLITAVAQSVEGAIPRNFEETILKTLSHDQKKTLKATRMSIQLQKNVNPSFSLTPAHSNDPQDKDPGVQALLLQKPIVPKALLPSEMMKTGDSEDELSAPNTERSDHSRPPPAQLIPMKRRSEFFSKPQRMNTWKMKSERTMNISAASRDDLVQIAENSNLLSEESSLNSLDTDTALPYAKHRTLHGRVDEICFAALKGEDPERKLLTKLLDGFYNWEQNHNIAANTIFQNSLGFNSYVDNMISALMKSSLNSEMPLLMSEVYEKIRNTVDYLVFRDTLDEEREKQLKFAETVVPAVVSTEQKIEPVGLKSPGGVTITSEANSSPVRSKRRSMIAKTTFDCATQTHFTEETVAVEVKSGPTDAKEKLSLIPPGFRLVMFIDDEFEVAPGIFLASAKRLYHLLKSQDPKLNRIKASSLAASTPKAGSLLNNRFKTVEQLIHELSEVPDNVRYCFGPAITPLTNNLSEMATIELPEPLKKAPPLLDLNIIKDCLAIVFPSSYPLRQGINLITGYKYNGQGNEYQFTKLTAFEGKNSTKELVTFPRDVVLLQMADGLDLPRGTYPLEFSYQIAYDSSLFYTKIKNLETRHTSMTKTADGQVITKEWAELKLPPGHELVQLINCCLDFPVGVEVSQGVRIAPVPSNLILPSNIKIVQKFKKTVLPDFMIPLKFLDQNEENILTDNNLVENDEDETISLSMRLIEGVTIVQKPKDVRFDIGIEMIRRPPGHPLPAGMKLVPKNEYPSGFVLPIGCELVKLTPKYDLPPTCRLTSSWYIYPRPEGVSLKPNHYIVFPDPSLEDHMVPPLPAYACQVPLPNLPYNVKLPNRSMCVELLLSRFTEFPLPEGCILGPGITVLNPKTLHGWTALNAKCPVNCLLVKRAPGSILPPTVERGSRSDLPSGILLGENMDVVRITVRFEVPPGVKIDVGVTLGPSVQLAPGTQLQSSVITSSHNLNNGAYLGSLTVVEWPYGITLLPGTELVRKPPSGCLLPFEYQQISLTHRLFAPLPEDFIIVRLPRAIKTSTNLQLAEQITVGLESMVSFSRPLPEGIIFASRNSRHNVWPSEMSPVPSNALPSKLLEVVEALNHESRMDEHKPHSAPTQRPTQMKLSDIKTKQRLNVEVVRLRPVHELPGGVHLHPDVVTVYRPFYMQLPPSVVLVELKKTTNTEEILKELARKGINQVDLSPFSILPANVSRVLSSTAKYLISSASKSTPTPTAESQVNVNPLSATADNTANEKLLKDFQLPSNRMFLQMPDVYDVYSWGENLPGVEAVLWNETNSHIALPPGHFLIERPRQNPQDELPCGFVLGVSEEYRHLRILSKSLPPQVEIMHILPSYFLPVGVNIINTSIIGRNTFNNNTGNTLLGTPGLSYTKKTFDPFWIPQFSPFEKVTRDSMMIPWPKDLTRSMARILQLDPQLFVEPHALIFLMKNVTKQEQEILEIAHYPPNLVKHSFSDEIVTELLKTQENHPEIQFLFQFIRKNSILGKFQDSSENNNNANDGFMKLKMHHIVHLVRISNGFPSISERYEKYSTKQLKHQPSPDGDEHAATENTKDSHHSQATNHNNNTTTNNNTNQHHQNKSEPIQKKKITLHPKLSRIERIKVGNIQEEMKKFLNELIIFRFYGSSHEHKEKLDYLKFDLIESTLWKALNSNHELEKNNDKLLQANNKLDKENIRITELLSTKQKVIDEMKQQVNKEEDLKALINKLKDSLNKKDQEISDLLAKQESLQAGNNLLQYSQTNSTIDEMKQRYQSQIDVLTTQLVDYENKIHHQQQQQQQRVSSPSSQLHQNIANDASPSASFSLQSRKEIEMYQKKVDAYFTNMIHIFNSFLMQLISQLDTEVFTKLASDYTLVDLFKESIQSNRTPAPQAYLGIFSSNQSVGSVKDDGALMTGPPSPSSSVYQGMNNNDDNSSVATENSLFSKLNAPTVKFANDLTQQSIASSSSVNDLTKDTTTGKKFPITSAFPLDVKSLYRHQEDNSKEFMSLSKPLMSKSLEILSSNTQKNKAISSVSTTGMNQSIDYATLNKNIDLFFEAKQKKLNEQASFFNDSFLAIDENPKESAVPGVDSRSLSYSAPNSPNQGRRRRSSASISSQQQQQLQQQAPSMAQPNNSLRNGEIELIQWKSDLENSFVSINSMFQDTLQSILLNIHKQKFVFNNNGGIGTIEFNDNELLSSENSTESKLRKRLPKGQQQQQQQQQGSSSSSSNDVEINWSNFELSIQLNLNKVIQIFQYLIGKYQKNYHKLLFHLENENILLMKALKQCKLHLNIVKGSYQLTTTTAPLLSSNASLSSMQSNHQLDQMMLYKEKIFQLEKKIDDLITTNIQSDTKPLEEMIAKFNELNEMEKSFKFLILMNKQMIVKEQNHCQFLQDRINNPMASRSNSPNNHSIHELTELLSDEKELKALQHYIQKMKNSLKDHEDRLLLIKQESNQIVNQIVENMEKYHQQVQSLFPSKLLSLFLSKSQFYFDKIHNSSLANPNQYQQYQIASNNGPFSPIDPAINRSSNKTILSPLPTGGGSVGNNFSSNMSVGSVGSLTSAGTSSADVLTELSKNLLQTKNPKTSTSIIGSMPPANSQSQFSNRLKNQQENSVHFSKLFENSYRKSKFN